MWHSKVLGQQQRWSLWGRFVAYQFGEGEIRHDVPTPYGCNPLRMIHVNPDGSLGMRQQLATRPSELRGPIEF